MIDVVIPLGIDSSWEHNELRYCLRSVEKYVEELNQIYIIGYKPNFLTNIIHIPCEDPFKQNKDANIIRKILKICDLQEISSNFLRLADDYLFLKLFNHLNYIPLHNGDLKEYGFTAMTRWRNRVKNTYEILELEKKLTYNYESHTPVIYNKEQFKNIFNKYNWGVEGEGYTINTLYFNNIDCKKKQLEKEKVCFEKNIEDEESILALIKGANFLNHNKRGLTEQLKKVIINLFPNKSKYEI